MARHGPRCARGALDVTTVRASGYLAYPGMRPFSHRGSSCPGGARRQQRRRAGHRMLCTQEPSDVEGPAAAPARREAQSSHSR
jgi:hypothetical protein